MSEKLTKKGVRGAVKQVLLSQLASIHAEAGSLGHEPTEQETKEIVDRWTNTTATMILIPLEKTGMLHYADDIMRGPPKEDDVKPEGYAFDTTKMRAV